MQRMGTRNKERRDSPIVLTVLVVLVPMGPMGTLVSDAAHQVSNIHATN
jgi:hypothetical protein